MRRFRHIFLFSLFAVVLASCSDRGAYADLAAAIDPDRIEAADAGAVLSAVAYYDRHGSAGEKMRAWYCLGQIQKNIGDIRSANISFMKAERWSAEDTGAFYKALIWQAISDIYHEDFLFDESLKYAELSYLASVSIPDTAMADLSRYRMAQGLGNLGRVAEADSLYRVLLAEGRFAPEGRVRLLADYAMLTLLDKDDCVSSVRLFDEALAADASLSGSVLNADHLGAYAYALLCAGKADRSGAVFRRLAAEDADDPAYRMWRSRADARSGDYAAAYEDLLFASEIRYRQVSHALRKSALAAQRDYIAEENAALQTAAIRQRLWLRVLLLGVFLLISGGTALFFVRRRRIQQEREAFLESVHSLSADLDEARDDRANLRGEYIKICQTHFKQVGRINEMLRNIAWDKDSPLYQELKKAVRIIQDDEKSQKEFEQLLNETLGNVMTHFRSAFPGKKERYYLLAGFLFAGFDAATISSLLYNCTKENVYIQKTRLKKSIRETDSPYKEQFLQLLS